MSAKRRIARKAHKPAPDPIIERALAEAEDSLKFGMMLLIRSHNATTQRPAELKLLALACLDEAVGKISTARLRHAGEATS